MRVIGVLTALTAGAFLTSCSAKVTSTIKTKPATAIGGAVTSKSAHNVAGKWLTPTGGSIEFKADGSAVMAGPNGVVELNYRLLNERTIEMSKPGGKLVIRWQILSVRAQELVIKDTDGKEVRLRRGG